MPYCSILPFSTAPQHVQVCHAKVCKTESCHSEEGKPTTKKIFPQYNLLKKKYWVQFSGHNFYVKMHNNKWQKSACFGMLSILISGLIVHNNDVSLLFLFWLVEAGLDVLVVNNFSCKSCRCWTFVFLKMFREVPSIVTGFGALPVLTAGENCTWSNFWPL